MVIVMYLRWLETCNITYVVIYLLAERQSEKPEGKYNRLGST